MCTHIFRKLEVVLGVVSLSADAIHGVASEGVRRFGLLDHEGRDRVARVRVVVSRARHERSVFRGAALLASEN